MSYDIDLFYQLEKETIPPVEVIVWEWKSLTWNLNPMWKAAQLFDALFRAPKRIHAYELLEPIKKGLEEMSTHQDKYIKFNPPNGWGTYEIAIQFLQELIINIIKYPHALYRCEY